MSDITEDHILEFYKKWKNGFLKSQLKSQDPPVSNTGAITIVVGKSFEELVIKSNKSVFMMIYDPTSITFAKLGPMWLDFAKQYINSDSLTIAMMDGKNNEIDSETFSEFPIFKLWQKGDKERPVNYIGEPDLEFFNVFLERSCLNCTNSNKAKRLNT